MRLVCRKEIRDNGDWGRGNEGPQPARHQHLADTDVTPSFNHYLHASRLPPRDGDAAFDDASHGLVECARCAAVVTRSRFRKMRSRLVFLVNQRFPTRSQFPHQISLA